MLKLFSPQTKVQKNRQIIRDTDMRMAKYSRRGLISNFLIYALCLVLEGSFMREHNTLAIVLTGGLLLVTLVRGYFLFRVDAIYPCAPSAWRTKYFLATLAGASWWGVILAFMTLYMDMKGEASLMWLYTVVFFSTTAHAFAPYKKFLSLYQFIGLVPASCCTFFIGEYIGPFYGFILLSFYIILNYHCSLMSENYWERLEAQYVLAQKSVSLEEEKRDTRASVQLSNQYIQLLGEKILRILSQTAKTTISQDNMLEMLFHNVEDFKKVLSKELEPKHSLFNVRHLLQFLVHSVITPAEKKHLEFESILSPALPSRMFGDPQMISRIVLIMINAALKHGKDCTLLMSIDFIREYEDSGELLVSIVRPSKGSKRLLFQSDDEPLLIPLSLDLVLAKGLAETLGGSLKIDEAGVDEGRYLQLRCPLNVAEKGARPEYHRLAYKGRPILLIHANSHWLNSKCLELEAMGFDVKVADNFKDGFTILKDAVKSGAVIQGVVYSITPDFDSSAQFCNEILEHNELNYIPQFIVCSESGESDFSQRLTAENPLIHYIQKPVGFFEFELGLSEVFEDTNTNYLNVTDGEQTQVPVKSSSILWVSMEKAFDNVSLYESECINVQCVAEYKQVAAALEENTMQLIVVEFSGGDTIECIVKIREEEHRLGRDAYIPIVGFGPESEGGNMLIAGVDHFVDQRCLTKQSAPSLNFWLKGGHH